MASWYDGVHEGFHRLRAPCSQCNRVRRWPPAAAVLREDLLRFDELADTVDWRSVKGATVALLCRECWVPEAPQAMFDFCRSRDGRRLYGVPADAPLNLIEARP